MKRPLCVLCYLVVATVGAAILSSTIFVSSASAQTPTEVVKRDVGTWNAELKMVIPGAGEMTMSGVETNRLLGDWVISDFKGEFQGVAFEGNSVYGYDEEKEKIVGTWVDNMPQEGTPRRLSIMEGNYDKDMDAIVSYMDGYDMTGNKVKEKHVVKYDGDDKRTMTMYQQSGDGEWTMMMEISYTRAGRPEPTAAKVQADK